MGALGALVASDWCAEARADTPAATLPFRQRPPELDHRNQFGFAIMPGIGYRVIARYEEGQSCLDDSLDESKWVCTSDVPLFLDFQLGYGVSSRLDVLADVRLGLVRDDVLGVGRQFAVAPGVRAWLDRDVRLKFFTTLQVLFDNTSQGQDRVAFFPAVARPPVMLSPQPASRLKTS
jgi:hypothetical protein